MDPVRGDGPEDMILLLVGPTKAGKSSFLNRLLPPQDDQFQVGKTLRSCTTEVCARAVTPEPSLRSLLQDRRLVLVDTPGFDDTDMEDEEVLSRISDWLEASYHRREIVGGVLYVHDITRSDSTQTTSRLFGVFSKLCGDEAMKHVVIVTTKWDRLQSEEDGDATLEELKGGVWHEAVAAGVKVTRLQPEEAGPGIYVDHQLPWAILVAALSLEFGVLRIQYEVAVQGLTLPETDAGKELRMTINKLLKKAKELRVRAREGPGVGRGADLLQSRRETIEKLIAQQAKVKRPGLVTRSKLWFYGITVYN